MPTADPIRCPYCVEDDSFILGKHFFDKEAYDAQNGTSSKFTYLARRPVYFLPLASTAPMLPLLPPALALSQIVPATCPTIQVRK